MGVLFMKNVLKGSFLIKGLSIGTRILGVRTMDSAFKNKKF